MPGRNLNDTERRLLERWNAGFGPSLRSIEITGGSSIRGFAGVTVDFRYPLVVLAGKNGTGKSTLLACAACAYHNTGPYEVWTLGSRYFRFTDFFTTTPQETPLNNAHVRWTYRMPDGTIAIQTATKGPTRWRGYSRRPDRAVEFVGLLRALHPSELRVLRRHFGTGVPPVPASLGAEHQATISRIMARNYEDVQIASSARYTLHYLHADGMCYSGFNMGSGEDVSCLLARIIHRLPPASLLVIEEIETGLHPAAQRNLIRQLLELCWERRLQVICSSHSPVVLDCVPADARVLLVRHAGTVQPRYRVSVNEAVSDIADLSVPELCIYVEDEVSRTLLLEVLPAQVRQRLRVATSGSWEDVIRFLAVFRRDPGLGCAAGILDGDREGRDAEQVDAFQRHLGRAVTVDDRQWLADRLRFLPGGVAPEQYLLRLGLEEAFRGHLATDLRAQQGVVDNFFREPPPMDYHSLSYNLGQRVGLDPDRVEIALAGSAVRCRADDFRPVILFLEARLEAEA